MRGVAELVHRRHLGRPVAAGDQNPRIAGKGRRVARHRNDLRDAAVREFARLRLGALARRIEDDGVERRQFLRHQGAAEEVEASCLDRLEAARRGGRPAQCVERVLVIVDGKDAGTLGKPERKRPDAGEQVGDARGRSPPGGIEMREREPRQRVLAECGRLQECAGRQHHRGAPDPDRRRRALRDQLAVAGDARELVRVRHSGKLERQRRGDGTGAANVEVDAGRGRGRVQIERLAHPPEHLRDCPGGIDRSGKTRREDRAMIDRHDTMGMQGRKTDFEDAARAASGMQNGTPAPFAVGVNEVGNRSRDPGPAQLLDHEVAFPVAIACRVPMLERAAAADAEMRADGRDSFGAHGFDAQQFAAIGMTGPEIDLDDLRGQRIGHVDRPCRRRRHAVAASPDMVDGEHFNQTSPPHQPSPAKRPSQPERIRGCRRPRRSARER